MNGFDGSLTFLDILTLLSFVIGVVNYEETLTQSDKQELLSDIHKHLSDQDAKIDHIIKMMEDSNDG